MKAEARSYWDSSRHKPNVYVVVKPETDLEKALMNALYFVKPDTRLNTSGEMIVDFYPSNPKKGRKK